MPIKHLKPKKNEGDWKVKKIDSVKRVSSRDTESSYFSEPRKSKESDLGGFVRQKKISSAPISNRNYRHKSNFQLPKINSRLPLAKYIFIGLVFIFLIGSIFALGAFAYYGRDLPDPDRLIERSIAQSTKIYDRTGEHILYEIHGDQRRTLIELTDLPEYVKWATITTEDRHFYSHHGFNLVATIKGVIIDPLMGKRARGGSTLTQQLVKNAILTDERKVSRKIKELILSIQIEKQFSKDQILKMYLNEIPYGSTAYGIEAASQTYLGKSAEDLNLSEAVTLASMPKQPSYYMNHQDELLTRRDYILDSMVEEGYISQAECDTAKGEKVVLRSSRDSITAPHFVMYIKELLSEKYGETVAEQGGLNVYTTLDLEKQQIAEEVLAEYGETNAENYNASNAALVCLDADTGDILAMVGSRDYFNDDIDGQVNVAVKSRQPGSSIKPMVYASLFEKGYTEDTILFDVPTNFAAAGDAYEPENYGGKTFGPVTIKKALAGSLNIPAVKALYLAGLDDVIDIASSMGYTTLNDKDRFGLSFVLGGGEVKLIEHTSAFSVFAQDGKYRNTRAILKVEDNQRKTLEENDVDNGKQVLDKQSARMLNDILSDNSARAYAFGENNYLTLGNIPVAAKTGTTNDNRDGWLMGYTPSIVTGVWVGNNDNSKMASNATGSTVAAPMWNAFMRRVLENKTIERFVKPNEIETEKPILNGEWKNETVVRINRITGLPADDSTPETFIEEKNYQEAHNILHYIDKDNPQGEVPEDPTQDSQYPGWEKGVQEWLAENEIDIDLAPTDEDVSAKNTLTVNILNPDSGDIDDLTIRASVENEGGQVSRLEYYLDDLYLGSTPIERVSFQPIISNLPSGPSIITVLAYDTEGNYGSNQKNVRVNSSYNDDRLTIVWHTLLEGETFVQEENIKINFSAKTKNGAQNLKIYVQTPDGNSGSIATSFGDRTFNQVSLDYSKTSQTGEYKIWLETDSGIRSNAFRFRVE